MILKKIKSLTLLLIIVVAFFDNSAKAQTFPLTNLIVHGWQKIDVLPYGVADTTIYKSVIWNASNGKLYKIGTMGGGGGSVDSLFVTYCCGCNMIDGWKALEDTINIDTCYVNTIIKDSLNAHWIALNGLIQDTANIVHWSDTTSKIATKYDIDTLSSSIYDSLANHYYLIGLPGLITDAYNSVKGGTGALPSNTGSENTAIGFNAMFTNVGGSHNTGIGAYSLYYNTTGADANTSIGWGSLALNNSGDGNTAVGENSLYYNKAGNANTAVGRYSLWKNIGNYNTAIGYQAIAGGNSIYATNNTAIGYQSLYGVTSGSENVAIGNFALNAVSTMWNNTGVGYAALVSNYRGVCNTSIGKESMIRSTTGSKNTAIGDSAMWNNRTASNCVAIGFQTALPDSNVDNQMNINNIIYENNNSIGIGTPNPLAKLNVYGNGGSIDLFNVTNDKDATKDSSVVVDAVGNVGIGKETPTAKLYVQDTTSAFGGTAPVVYVRAAKPNKIALGAVSISVVNEVHPDYNIGLYASSMGGTNNFAGYFNKGDVYIDNNLGIGRLVPTYRLDVFGNGGTTNLLKVSNDINSTYDSTFVVNKVGKVGIGTTTPKDYLDINGNITFPNNKYIFWNAYNKGDTIYQRNMSGNGVLMYQKTGNADKLFNIDVALTSDAGNDIPIAGQKSALSIGVDAEVYIYEEIMWRDSLGDFQKGTTLSDNESYSLPTGYSWKGEIDVDSLGYTLFTAQIRCDDNGTPYLEGVSWKRWSSKTYVEVGSTDGYLNITDGGSGMVITNTLGYTIKATLRFRTKQ